jgi:peptide/nickel transport system permease protein
MNVRVASLPLRRSNLLLDTWHRFERDHLAAAGGIVLLALAIAAAGAPLFTRYAPNEVDLARLDAAPSAVHWFGTDDLGRDEFSRALYAGRVSLSIGVGSAIVAALVGTAVGATAGYHGGVVDSLLMRVTDVMLSIPPLPLVIVLSAIAKPSPTILILIIAGIGWMGTARLVRGALLSIRETEYVEAARAAGCGSVRIILRHALPNSLAPIIVAATLAVGNAIITESVLSFLGVGIQPPTASWGNMLQNAQSTMTTKPWLSVFPGVFILLSVLGVNALGDGLRDALDVRMNE